jgi:hypothetical protein
MMMHAAFGLEIGCDPGGRVPKATRTPFPANKGNTGPHKNNDFSGLKNICDILSSESLNKEGR